MVSSGRDNPSRQHGYISKHCKLRTLLRNAVQINDNTVQIHHNAVQIYNNAVQIKSGSFLAWQRGGNRGGSHKIETKGYEPFGIEMTCHEPFEIETTGYEPFDLHGPVHCAMLGECNQEQGGIKPRWIYRRAASAPQPCDFGRRV